MPHTTHQSVLLREAVDALASTPDATVIDATLGSGGHFSAIVEKLGESGRALGIDVDPLAVRRAQERFAGDARIQCAVGNFRHIADVAAEHGISAADSILADLGWRSEQFSGNAQDGGGKGFSFSADEPLFMTLGDPAAYPFTAGDIVQSWSAEDIENVLRAYGEERFARRIARAIVERRAEMPIETAAALAEVVSHAVPGWYRHRKVHPATKTFQALRIAVNDELDALREFIEGAYGLLNPGGRLALISFHSIEDRIVKQAFRAYADAGRGRRITKKPIVPSATEVGSNPRARSAKLRILEKI